MASIDKNGADLAPGGLAAPNFVGRSVDLATTGVALALVGFMTYGAVFGEFPVDIQRGVPFGLITPLVLLRYPLSRRSPWFRLVDLALAVGGTYADGYLVLNGGAIATRMGRLLLPDVVASIIGIVVLLEIARRTIGWVLPAVALAFMGYTAFGNLLPDPLGHRGFPIERVALASWAGSDGVFGIAFGVVVSIVYLYMLFGAMLERSGGSQALVDLARLLSGRVRSGPGLTAVAGSALFGMVSGSGVADVAAVGSANIPVMKKAGYTPEFAAGVQALSSIGAQVMPPVMGASAFILAQLTNTPYVQVAAMATLPALLYYGCVASAVHFAACRSHLGVERPGGRARPSLHATALALVPIGLLLYLLVTGMNTSRAALWAMVSVLVLTALKRETRLGPGDLVRVLREGTTGSLPLWTATATIGLIIAAVAMTGLGNLFSATVVTLSAQNLFLALVVTMVASIILGTAVPTVAAYLLLVILIAPALAKMGMPLVIAHLFIFYFGVTSDLTPPTALAPLTAAGIAGANFWRTCWVTMRIGLPIFVLPFAFVYNPALLLRGQPWEVALSFASAMMGMIAFSAGIIGYLLKPLKSVQRVVLLVGGLAMLAPSALVVGAGLVGLAAVVVSQRIAPRVIESVEVPGVAPE